MKHNIGKTDRVFRLGVAFAMIITALLLNKWFWAVGLYFLLTGMFSWCPFYKLIGINTSDKKGTR